MLKKLKEKENPAINLDSRFSSKNTKRGNDVALEDWGVFKGCVSGCDPSITLLKNNFITFI
jgi:hypothetical protein